MSRMHTILKGTFILTLTGLITRVMGFFYRIFLSQTFGEEGVGLYQLIFPIYALGFSITSAGIELALSRSVSKYIALNNKKKAQEMLCTGIILTLVFSTATMIALQKYASCIATNFLHTPETYELLLLISYIFPVAAIHSCIIGYYLGLKNPKTPATSQLFEQCFRIFSVFFFYKLSTVYDFNFQISFAIIGLIIGETAACMFCIKSATGKFIPVFFPKLSAKNFYICSRELLLLAIPITSNRVLLNILQSIEAVSVPVSLKLYGLNSTEALSIYGVLTGMALPCILFPSAITNAISTMLLPTVTEIQTLHDNTTLIKIIKKTLFYCTLLGTACCIAFLLFGNTAGKLMFNSVIAGKFIITLAWMCPFLYTNSTLISIINGMGKTFITLIINALNLIIRILSIFLAIPRYGIYGYLIGLLLGQIFVFFSSLLYLYTFFKAKDF